MRTLALAVTSAMFIVNQDARPAAASWEGTGKSVTFFSECRE